MRGTASFLTNERERILAEAEEGLARMHAAHYERAGVDVVQQRLRLLFDELVDAIEQRDIGSMLAYARAVAEERFGAGYDLSEVQTAFNALEEATWRSVLGRLDPSEFAEALGLITTVLGAGKDQLARAYVALAAGVHAPSLDLRSLFAGTS